MNQNIYKYKNFFDNYKLGFNPHPYKKHNNSFPTNKKFNKTGTKTCVPAANGKNPVASGANATLLQIKCWKCTGPHYAQDCKNKTGGVLHNLQEEPTKEEIAGTPWIYAALDGRQEYHQATMVEIEGKILNTSISILIDPSSFQSYVSPKIVDECKLGKVKCDKPWLVQLANGTKREVLEIVKDCEVNLNGYPTKVNLNILPLGLYDILINMD